MHSRRSPKYHDRPSYWWCDNRLLYRHEAGERWICRSQSLPRICGHNGETMYYSACRTTELPMPAGLLIGGVTGWLEVHIVCRFIGYDSARSVQVDGGRFDMQLKSYISKLYKRLCSPVLSPDPVNSISLLHLKSVRACQT